MQLKFNPLSVGAMTSGSQRTRVRTESWFAKFGYCLRCTSDKLEATKPNTPACDFICPICDAPYELKSGAGRLGLKVVDGAFDAMMRGIRGGRAPNLLFLRYSIEAKGAANEAWSVDALTALHSVFLTPMIVEKRAPLAATARRAGWVGCNLLLSRVPDDGRIALIRDGVATARTEARRLYALSERFEELKPKERGWSALVLSFVRKLGKEHFTTNDILRFEPEMHAVYPDNSHKREKVRQQLQVLMRLGYIDRTAPSEYRVLL